MTADLTAGTGQSSWVKGVKPPPPPPPPPRPPAASATLRKLSPAVVEDELPEVKFAFNPEKITLSHTYKTEGASGASADEQIKNLGYIEIGIDKLYFLGPTTKICCDTLIAWSCPVPVGVVIGTRGLKSRPILLEFSWKELSFEVKLRTVSITYQRFLLENAMPIRAEVKLSLYMDISTDLPSTNPTSGGPAGRSSRVLDASECLPSLASANYGRPGAWRQIATANGIDDPLRVRPGTLIYLPESGAANSAGGSP